MLVVFFIIIFFPHIVSATLLAYSLPPSPTPHAGTYIDPSVDTVTGNHNHSNSQGSSGNRGELTSRSALGDLSLSRQPHQQGRSLGSTDHHHHRNGHGHGASPLRRPVRPASGDENGADNSVTSTLETLAKLKRLGEN